MTLTSSGLLTCLGYSAVNSNLLTIYYEIYEIDVEKEVWMSFNKNFCPIERNMKRYQATQTNFTTNSILVVESNFIGFSLISVWRLLIQFIVFFLLKQRMYDFCNIISKYITRHTCSFAWYKLIMNKILFWIIWKWALVKFKVTPN